MPIIDTEEEFKAKVDAFFADPPTVQVRTKDGYKQADNVTQSALARHLGYASGRAMTMTLRECVTDWRFNMLGYIKEKAIEYWMGAAMVGDNPTFPRWVLGGYGISDNPLNTRQKLNFDEADSEIQKAAKVLMAGGKGEIEPVVVTSYINSIKAMADIRKTSELEERIQQLEEIANIGD